MFSRFFRRFREAEGAPDPVPESAPSPPPSGPDPGSAQRGGNAEVPPHGTEAPPESRTGPDPSFPGLPPGWTLREYLEGRIRDRSRWLKGRYGEEPGGEDHEALLDSLRDPNATAIRRPPVAARRLLHENRKPDTSLGKLAAIIETDPALVQSLLKHANSVFYASSAGAGPLMSVPPALRRLGSRGIEIVVMSHMVEGSLCRPGEGLDEMAARVWSHMVRVAPLARHLSPAFDVDGEEAYAMGLLHDVGKLILFNRVADLRKRLRREVRLTSGFISGALRELHEPLGALAVLEWGLGEEAAMAVAVHHRRSSMEHSPVLSQVLFLAERLDLLTEEGAEPRLEALWARGELTVPLEAVAHRWEALREREAEGTQDPREAMEGAA